MTRSKRFGLVDATAWAGHSRRRLGSIAPYLRPRTPEDLRPIPEALFGPLDGPLLAVPCPAVGRIASARRARGVLLTPIPLRQRGARP